MTFKTCKGLMEAAFLRVARGSSVLQTSMVAGACSPLIVRRSFTSPISIGERSGGRKFQAIAARDTS